MEASAATSNGIVPDEAAYKEFYARIVSLQDDIIAGRHPRVTLSADARQRLAQSTLKERQDLEGRLRLSASHGSSIAAVPVLNGNESVASALPAPPPAHPAPSASKPLASGFDPLLLAKSDTLIHAELMIKRRPIDNALRESFQKSRGKGHDMDRDAILYDGPHILDAAKVLAQAQTLVPHVSGYAPVVIAADEPDSSSSSVDENSYYSSQVMSWTPEDIRDQRDNAAGRMTDHAHGEGRPSSAAEPSPGRAIEDAKNLQRALGQRSLSVAATTDSDSSIEPRTSLSSSSFSPASRDDSYSPPPAATVNAAAPHMPSASFPQPVQEASQNSYSALLPALSFMSGALPPQVVPPPTISVPNSSSNRTRESESYSPPPIAATAQLVSNNHISTPVAPQPSRVSPLVHDSTPNGSRRIATPQLTKQSKQYKPPTKNKKKKGKAQPQVVPSNQFPDPIVNPRKRPREAEPAVSSKRATAHRPGEPQVASPVPYIKTEPMSPPPTNGDDPFAPRRLVVRPDGSMTTVPLYPKPVDDTNDRPESAQNFRLGDGSGSQRLFVRPDGTITTESSASAASVARRLIVRSDGTLATEPVQEESSAHTAEHHRTPRRLVVRPDGTVTTEPLRAVAGQNAQASSQSEQNLRRLVIRPDGTLVTEPLHSASFPRDSQPTTNMAPDSDEYWSANSRAASEAFAGGAAPNVSRGRNGANGDRDLRRVASLQHAAREQLHSAASSYSMPVAPFMPSATERPSRRYIEIIDEPAFNGQTRYREIYRPMPAAEEATPYSDYVGNSVATNPPMSSTQRRVYLDENGNQCYLVPVGDGQAAPQRQRAQSHFVERPSNLSRADSFRHPQVVEILDDEESSFMPPPTSGRQAYMPRQQVSYDMNAMAPPPHTPRHRVMSGPSGYTSVAPHANEGAFMTNGHHIQQPYVNRVPSRAVSMQPPPEAAYSYPTPQPQAFIPPPPPPIPPPSRGSAAPFNPQPFQPQFQSYMAQNEYVPLPPSRAQSAHPVAPPPPPLPYAHTYQQNPYQGHPGYYG